MNLKRLTCGIIFFQTCAANMFGMNYRRNYAFSFSTCSSKQTDTILVWLNGFLWRYDSSLYVGRNQIRIPAFLVNTAQRLSVYGRFLCHVVRSLNSKSLAMKTRKQSSITNTDESKWKRYRRELWVEVAGHEWWKTYRGGGMFLYFLWRQHWTKHEAQLRRLRSGNALQTGVWDGGKPRLKC